MQLHMQLLLHLPYNLAQLIFIALAQRTAGRLAEDIIAAAIRIQITIVVVIIFSRYWSKSIIRNAFRFIGCLTCFIWYFTFGIVESTALQGKHTWAANYWLIVGICSFKRFCHYLVTICVFATFLQFLRVFVTELPFHALKRLFYNDLQGIYASFCLILQETLLNTLKH